MSYQKFTKNIGMIGFVNLLVTLEGIILLPIITKLLGAKNYGIWTQLMVTLSLISPIVILGLPHALIRFLASQKDKKEIQEGVYSVLTLVFAVALIITLLFISFSDIIADFFQSQPVLIKILALIILVECLNLILLRTLQAFQEIGKYSSLLVLKTTGGLGLIIAAVFLGYGLYGAVVSLLIIRVIVFLIASGLIFKKIGIRFPNFSRIKEYLSFSLPMVVSSTSYWTVTSSDRYLIGFFLGVLSVGYYNPAYSIGNILNFFIYPLFFMLPVVLSRSFDENKISEVKTYLKYSLKYFLMIAIPSVFGLSILSKTLLTTLSTPEIAVNGHFITPFVALSILLYGVSAFFIQILYLFKKTKLSGTIWVGVALLNLSLNFIFIPRFGILGAAITTLLSYIFALLLTWYYSFKDLRFEVDWQFIIKSIFASALMTLFIAGLSPVGLSNIIIAIVTGSFLYGILIWLLRGFNKKEINFLKGFLGKVKFLQQFLR